MTKSRLQEQLFRIARTPGAISMTEAWAIYSAIITNLSSRVEQGHVLDLGSHAGKSTMVMSAALACLGRAELIHMVDPVYDLNNEQAWRQTIQGTAKNLPWGYCCEPSFKDDVIKRVYEVSSLVPVLHGLSSVDFLAKYDYTFSCVFIDSDDHQPELVMHEARLLENRVKLGGLVFFHDYKNQYVGPYMASEELLKTGKYELVGVNWVTITPFVNEYRLEENNNSWHMPGVANPNFVGILRRIA